MTRPDAIRDANTASPDANASKNVKLARTEARWARAEQAGAQGRRAPLPSGHSIPLATSLPSAPFGPPMGEKSTVMPATLTLLLRAQTGPAARSTPGQVRGGGEGDAVRDPRGPIR